MNIIKLQNILVLKQNHDTVFFFMVGRFHLLCFRLTFASPLANDITTPRDRREIKGVLDVGAAGIKENTLRTAIRAQLTP